MAGPHLLSFMPESIDEVHIQIVVIYSILTKLLSIVTNKNDKLFNLKYVTRDNICQKNHEFPYFVETI